MSTLNRIKTKIVSVRQIIIIFRITCSVGIKCRFITQPLEFPILVHYKIASMSRLDHLDLLDLVWTCWLLDSARIRSSSCFRQFSRLGADLSAL